MIELEQQLNKSNDKQSVWKTQYNFFIMHSTNEIYSLNILSYNKVQNLNSSVN